MVTSALRLLVVPGLHDSGPAHWQSLLQSGHRAAVRVRQHDWTRGDLDRWAERIGQTLQAPGGTNHWLAVAHSFGCLALARQLALQPACGIRAALFVAPADPRRFAADTVLPRTALPVPTTMVVSENDPWMDADTARVWGDRWGSRCVSLGMAGHINAESGFGPFPFARRWIAAATQRLAREQRVAEQRDADSSVREWPQAVGRRDAVASG